MDRILSIYVFITFCLLLVPSLGQPQGEVACQKCFYVEYRTRNVPTLVKTILEMLLSKLNLSNPDCMSNKVVPETCDKTLNLFLMENKCTTLKINMKAVGLKSIFSEAELDVNVVVRSCKSVAYGTRDKCLDLSEIGASERAEFMRRMKYVETQWSNITYSGNFCTTSP